MKPNTLLLVLAALPASLVSYAQSTTIPLGSQDYLTLDRMEILSGKIPWQFEGSVKPVSRKAAVAWALQMDSIALTRDTLLWQEGQDTGLNHSRPLSGPIWSSTDRYDMKRLIANSGEWAPGSNGFTPSRHPLFKGLYQNTTNLLLVNQPDFFLSVNPVLLVQGGKELDNPENLFIDTRGVEVRGMIDRKVGFYSYLSDNQELDPLYVQALITKDGALPGEGYYKPFGSSGVDYFNATGYITFTAAKYIDIEFGYGKNFLGNGYRSLFLSDYSSPYLYLKLHTHIWKLDYENIFGQVVSQFQNTGDYLRPEKYIAIHQLSYNPNHWLDLGVFEAISFARSGYFDFAYLNPIIFYKSVEEALGSSDKAHVGLTFKTDFAHHFQLYSQFLLDEFKLNQFFSSSGWWGNKWGFQIGGKYINAFSIPNLDLQGEINLVRPYTYAHYDSVSNYSNYNQPLAHPLGANFREFIGIARYQYKRLYLTGKLIYYDQGMDSLDGNSNFGGNILVDYLNNIPNQYGNYIGQGIPAKVGYASLLVSYELRDNFFLDLYFLDRLEGGAYFASVVNRQTRFLSLGIHWNIARREFDY